LAGKGIFRTTRPATPELSQVESELVDLLKAKDFQAFMRLAVKSRRNILVSGPTGSGKTTFTKALIREIPSDERLITIEDAKELVLDRHPNHVRLFYSKDDQGLARVTPKQLLESCLRMKPDRILLAELRGEEAFDYLRNVNSGHPGSITSIHAASAELAFEQLVLLVKQSRAGQDLARADIKNLLYLLIDVVVQFGVEHRERCIREVWFDPARKHRTLAAH
jgi:type IV secretion system protein VirB11